MASNPRTMTQEECKLRKRAEIHKCNLKPIILLPKIYNCDRLAENNKLWDVLCNSADE